MFSLLLGYLVWGKALMKSLVKCTYSRDSTPQRLHTHTHTSLTACECGTDSTLPRPLCANKKEFIQRPVADFYLFVTNRVSTHVLGMPWLLRTTRITSGRSATSPLHTWWFRRTAPVEGRDSPSKLWIAMVVIVVVVLQIASTTGLFVYLNMSLSQVS